MATCRLLLCAVACKQGKYRHPCQVLNVSTFHDEGLLRRVVQVRRLLTILTLFAIAATLAAGMRTRRTGTSISILGIDGTNGFTIDGERRPANLEDVFVLLTGEEIA